VTRVVFLDGGARAGEALDWYVNKRPDLAGCEVHFFEPNPNHREALEELCRQSRGRMKSIHAAVGTSAGTAKLFTCLEEVGDLGNSLFSESRCNLDRDHPVDVQMVDLASYILENFEPQDYLVLKLDVQGAEYQLVPHLISTGAIALLDEIHVEWHDYLFEDTSIEIDAPKVLLQEAVREHGLRYEEWPY
jgi:FkbM family methyltransferase